MLLLQGCDMDQQIEVPSHHIGNWHKQPDYLIKYEFIPPGTSVKDARLNSCSLDIAPTLQCSGRGVCKSWDPDTTSGSTPLNFCECNLYWSDPECRTPRKSQCYAYLFSLFLGFLGADQFYLGFHAFGIMKLVTFGGFGIWWLIDVIRIGCAPVMALEFRLAADLPHWAFVLSLVSFFLLVGFLVAARTTLLSRYQRRKDGMLMQVEEEARRWNATHNAPRPKMSKFYAGKSYGSDGQTPPSLVPNWYGGMKV